MKTEGRMEKKPPADDARATRPNRGVFFLLINTSLPPYVSPTACRLAGVINIMVYALVYAPHVKGLGGGKRFHVSDELR